MARLRHPLVCFAVVLSLSTLVPHVTDAKPTSGNSSAISSAGPAKNSNLSAKAKPENNWDSKSELMFAHLMCVDGEYFRECFSSSRAFCEEAMKREARACDADLLPQKRKAIQTEVQLFAEIGVCVGTTIEKKWRDRKANSAKCDSKENWQ